MVTANSVLTLPEAESFTVEDLYELQGRERLKVPSISPQERSSLRRSLQGESSIGGQLRKALFRFAVDFWNIVRFLVTAPGENASWFTYFVAGRARGKDVTAGRERMSRLRSVSGLPGWGPDCPHLPKTSVSFRR